MSHTMEPEYRTVEARHIVHASANEVFDAWITADLVEAWWGPEGYKTKVLLLEAKEGGQFEFQMTSHTGDQSLLSGFYREIKRPNRLVLDFMTHCNTDLPDNIEPQLQASVVTVEFVEQGSATEVIVVHAHLMHGYAELASLGWSSSLARLDYVDFG